nr:claspin-like [Lepeophtheirus salmonis]
MEDENPLNNSPEEEIKLTLDSDSDDEEQDPKAKEDKSPDNRISSSDEEDEIKIHNGQRGKSVGRIRLDLSDDDEETNIEGEEVQNKDPSSDEDEVDSPLVLEGDEKREEDSNPEGISSMSVKERASNLFEIRSTSQRRLRESSVHIPYHIPKKLSLDEFLSRRKSGNDLNLREKEIESTYQEDEDKDVLDPELKSQSPSIKSSLLLKKLGVDLPSLVHQSQPKISSNNMIDLGSIEKSTTHKKDRVISVVTKEVKENGSEVLEPSQINVPDEATASNVNCSINFDKVEKAKRSDVSGAQFRALKETLKLKMMEARKKDLIKKELLKKMEEENYEEDGFNDNEEDITDEENVSQSEGETESEPEEEPEIFDKKTPPKNGFIDFEAEDDQEEEIDDNDNDDVEEDDEEETGPLTLEEDSILELTDAPNENPSHESPSQTSNCQGQEDSSKNTTPFSQLANNSTLRWTPIEERAVDSNGTTNNNSLTQQHARKRLGFEELFDASDPCVDDFSDVVGLCSGQFLANKRESLPYKDTAITMSQMKSSSISSSMPLDVDTQDTLPLIKASPCLIDDVEDEPFDGFKSRRVATQRMILSDDSSDDEEDNGDVEEDDPLVEESREGAMEEDVEYDSEENEIPTKGSLFDKKGLLREDFLEKEAELSGSDEGSEDEDEVGMDDLEMEEGDMEDFDQDKMREEVGKIHHNQILDEDRREVRLLKEAFLEDGDLHSEKTRGRSFRWLNNGDVNEELEKRPSDDEAEVEDDKTEKLRLDRVEREKWIKNSASIIAESDDENVENSQDDDSQLIQLGNKALRKLENSKKPIISVPSKHVPPSFTPSKKLPLQAMKNNGSKGSFLSRASEKLTKIAELAKNKGETREGSGAKGNSKNFVFCAISPKKVSNGDAFTTTTNQKKSSKKFRKETATCPASKRPKIERTLDDGNTSTIFGFLK